MRILVVFVLGFTFGLFPMVLQWNPLLLIPLLFLGVSLLFWRFPSPHWKGTVLLMTLGYLVANCYGFLYTQRNLLPLESYYGETRLLRGEVLEYPQPTSYSYEVLVDFILDDKPVRSQLYLDSQGSELKPGDQIFAFVEIHSSYTTFSGVPITYYLSNGVHLRCVAEGDIILQGSSTKPWRYIPVGLAEGLRQGIETVFPEEYVAVILGMVTGNRDPLSTELATALQRCGMSHTVAISGMHLAFLAGGLFFLLPRYRPWSTGIVILTLVGFMLVSGSTPSVTRATIMLVMLLLAPLFGREQDGFTALATAVLVILLRNPYEVASVGLQLSVASVVGIFLFTQRWRTGLGTLLYVNWKNKKFHWKKALVTSVAVTCGALVFTMPLIVLYFQTISFISPLANFLCLWSVSILFITGLSAGILGAFCPFLGKILAMILCILIWIFQSLVLFLARMPFASLTLDALPYRNWFWCAYALLLLLFLTQWNPTPLFPRSKWGWLFPVVLWASTFALAFVTHYQDYVTQSPMLESMSQGDGASTLLTIGSVMIAQDCGGSSGEETGNLLGNRLEGLGRWDLDLLLLTSLEESHIQGLPQLLSRCGVKVLALPYDRENPLVSEIEEWANRYQIELWYIREDTRVPLEEGYEIAITPQGEGLALWLCQEDEFSWVEISPLSGSPWYHSHIDVWSEEESPLWVQWIQHLLVTQTV